MDLQLVAVPFDEALERVRLLCSGLDFHGDILAQAVQVSATSALVCDVRSKLSARLWHDSGLALVSIGPDVTMRFGSLSREQVIGLAVVMTGSFVAALDQSIVATVMPTVIGELGGIDRYALVFSAYLLVSTVATPILGRLADVYGRTPVFVGGMTVFVLGSLGAGLSGDMLALIVSRAVQGFGAGALLPVGMMGLRSVQ